MANASFGRRDISKILAGSLPPIASQLPPSGPRNGGFGSEPGELARFSGGYQVMPVSSMVPFDLNSVEERLRQLEVRMTIAERSGRTVWDETMRTQTELRRAVDHVIKRDSSSSAIDSSADSLMATRLNAHLQSYSEGRTLVASQLSDVKQKQIQLNARLEQALTLIEDSNRANDELQRINYRLTNDLQTLSRRVEGQNSQLVDLSAELKSSVHKFEHDGKRVVDNLQHQNDMQTQQMISQLKSQTDKRLTEMRDTVVSLRDQLDKHGHELKSLEHAASSRNAEVQSTLAGDQRRLNESLSKLESKVLEQDRTISSQYNRIQAHIADSLTDMVLKASQSEKQLRKELAMKMQLVVQMFSAEEKSRSRLEKFAKSQSSDFQESVKIMMEEELKKLQQELKDYIKDSTKIKDNVKALNDAVELVDRSLQEQKKQLDKLLAAEINSRQLHEDVVSQRITAIEQQLIAVQVSTEQKIEDRLRQADARAETSAIKEQITESYAKIDVMQRDNKQHYDRLGDLVARVEALEQSRNNEETNDSGLGEAETNEEEEDDEEEEKEEEEEEAAAEEETANEEDNEAENEDGEDVDQNDNEEVQNDEQEEEEDGEEEETEEVGGNDEEETNEPEADETEEAENEDEEAAEDEEDENTEEQEEADGENTEEAENEAETAVHKT